MEIAIGEVVKDLRSKVVNRQLAYYLSQLYERFGLEFSLLDVGCGAGNIPEISQPT